ncbi:MAG: hypothetical protein ABI569_13295 [Casimicrobiaceae bacterium]
MEAAMPVNLSIKAVPDALAAGLRARAAANHRSLQRELMAIIEVAAANPSAWRGRDASIGPHRTVTHEVLQKRTFEQVADELRALFPRTRSRGPSSTEIIRQMRDGRYGRLDAHGKAIK